MIRVPILAVLTGGQGTILELEIEAREEGKGQLFFESRLTLDDTARTALKTAFGLLEKEKADILVRIAGEKEFCLCGGSFALPVYLGMYACTQGMELKAGVYATGCINEKGEITAVRDLEEKRKAALGKAERILVPRDQALPANGIEMKEVSDIHEAIEYALKEPLKQQRVLIYGTDTCPFCTQARAAYGDRAIYINVEENPDKLEEMLVLSEGRNQVPVIVDGDKVTVGFAGEASLRGGLLLHGGT